MNATLPREHVTIFKVLGALISALAAVSASATDLPNLNDIPPDLSVPAVVQSAPAPGLRVQATTTGWEHTGVHHALYLPRDWKPGAKLPVLIEYPGNGGYKNRLDDVSDGTVEGCVLGYGLSGGEGFIWASLPFVEIHADGTKGNCAKWWGDLDETKRYCIQTVHEICARYGGDSSRVVLCGFSRGSIACNYLGLADDEIAGLWRAFFCHSHYDGVRSWAYPGADAASAKVRLQRLRGRPQWISHEGTTEETRKYLETTGVTGSFTFLDLPYANHSAGWVLRYVPARQKAREWLARVAR